MGYGKTLSTTLRPQVGPKDCMHLSTGLNIMQRTAIDPVAYESRYTFVVKSSAASPSFASVNARLINTWTRGLK